MFCCRSGDRFDGQVDFLTSVICPVPTAAVGENNPAFVMTNPHAPQRKLISKCRQSRLPEILSD